MIKASALYIVIVVATVVAIFTGTFITTAFFYRQEVQKSVRLVKLQSNLFSGIALALSENILPFPKEKKMDLFGETTDSINISLEPWGIYDLAVVKSYEANDTLEKAFLRGVHNVDPAALYLSDEDRPLSVSGKTQIKGDAELPRSGIRQAYVEGQPYSGAKMVYGAIRNSERSLPPLDANRIAYLSELFEELVKESPLVSGKNSFYNSPITIYLNSDIELAGSLEGRFIVCSDSLVRITKTAHLNNVLVFAPSIVVEPGFKGSCQLFARDSVVVGKNAVFEYPSAIGVLKNEGNKNQCRVELAEGCRFSGVLFSYEKDRSDLQTMVSLGKDCHIQGEVYACGYVKMYRPLRVDGKVSCNRFIIQTPTTLYENYLIDITIDRNKRNPHYLSSFLFDNQYEKQVLKWLE